MHTSPDPSDKLVAKRTRQREAQFQAAQFAAYGFVYFARQTATTRYSSVPNLDDVVRGIEGQPDVITIDATAARPYMALEELYYFPHRLTGAQVRVGDALMSDIEPSRLPTLCKEGATYSIELPNPPVWGFTLKQAATTEYLIVQGESAALTGTLTGYHMSEYYTWLISDKELAQVPAVDDDDEAARGLILSGSLQVPLPITTDQERLARGGVPQVFLRELQERIGGDWIVSATIQLSSDDAFLGFTYEAAE